MDPMGPNVGKWDPFSSTLPSRKLRKSFTQKSFFMGRDLLYNYYIVSHGGLQKKWSSTANKSNMFFFWGGDLLEIRDVKFLILLF